MLTIAFAAANFSRNCAAIVLGLVDVNGINLNDNDASEDEQEELEANLFVVNLAVMLRRIDFETRPGRGLRYGNAPSRDPSILGFNITISEYVLSEPAKCICIIGVTSKEFYHLLPYIMDEVRNHECPRSAWQHKADIKDRLFVYLFFLKVNLDKYFILLID